ncbi:MAG: DUF1552 domain-containing protein [Polyangiales bacterium]
MLRGLGGAAVSLPFLEGLAVKTAFADGETTPPFAIFFRQANGCQQRENTSEIGEEPERFFPRSTGMLTTDSVSGRALDELSDHLSSLLVVGNVNGDSFPYGDGHANGALQGLTARGPTTPEAGGDSEAAGQSIDDRIGQEVNPEGRDSLFLYCGRNAGWLGGACISYRSAGTRRAPVNSPWTAYQQIVGTEGGLSPEAQMQIAERRKSVNDLVRGQMQRLMRRPELSEADRSRLRLHFEAIRDLEVSMTCHLDEDRERMIEGESPGYDSTDGDEVLQTARLHMDVAALAVSCGYTRSVAIQVGSGNDGNTRYRNPETGTLMENFHYVSHRRLSHDASGSIIENSDYLHHLVDRQFAQTFGHLVQRLSDHEVLDCGVACWYNDNSNGPPHAVSNIPWILAGSCNGRLKQGQYIEVSGDGPNLAKMHNTIGAAVGATNDAGEPLDDFGDPSMPRGRFTELLTG